MRAGNFSNLDNKSENIDNMKNKIQKKHIIKMIIWLILAIFVIYQVYILVMYTIGKKDKDKMLLYNSLNSIVGIFVKNQNNLSQDDYSLKLAALGDIYVDSDILKSAKSGNQYDFSTGTDSIKEKLNEFDVVIASLANPVVDKSLGYSTNSTYSAPIDLLDTLKQLKVSVVATATKDAMDKNEKGITSTIQNLKDSSIEQVGIGSDGSRSKPIVISKNEISIGLLSYATESNVKISSSKSYLVNMLDDESLKEDIEYLKSKNVDYIIAYLNDPNENSSLTSSEQKKNVEKLFNSGVNVVMGTGSMIVQGQIEDQISVNENTTNHVYAIYSLGDFMGSYNNDENMSNVIANIEFTKSIKKNKKGDVKSTITDMKINTPIYVWTTLSANYAKKMYIMSDELNLYNSGKSKLSTKQYNKLYEENERLKGLFE